MSLKKRKKNFKLNMNYKNDKRTVLTLDAGGTNFVFSAVQGNEEIVEPVTIPSHGDNLPESLKSIENGFEEIKSKLKQNPVAISFSFPGPADYQKGIIGDLGNLPGYRGGVPLGSILKNHFNLPVFINNDGGLYAYGEAIAGYLPYINNILKESGSAKRYKNLIGFTLGTGFGGGIVINNELLTGDNSNAGEVWLLRSKVNPKINAEETISIRAVKKFYSEKSRIRLEDSPEPKIIYEIATGKAAGNKEAAIYAYKKMSEALGDAIANVLTVIDGIAVIGGGIAAASLLFMPALIDELNSKYVLENGNEINRLDMKVFNLENESDLRLFIKGEEKEIPVPGSNEKIIYDPQKKTGVGISKIGTSKAVSIGAYAFALNMLDK